MKRKRMLFLLLCVCLAASAAAGCTSEGPASALSDPLPSQGGEIQGMPVELRVETPVQPGASVLRLWWVNRGETDVSYSPHTNISIEVWQDGAWMEVPKTPDALLSSPNNILGVEYLRALLRLQSSIRPVTIRREGDGYHETGVRDGVFASATALRRVLREDGKHGLSSLAGQVPEDCLPLLMEGRFLFPEDFSRILDYAILTKEGDGFLKYAGFSRELAGRLAARSLETGSWQDRVLQLKTKNYTYTRISRALLSLVLDVRAEDLSRWREGGMSAPYARILGFKRSAIPLLSAIKAHSAIPLISKPADAGRLLSPEAFSMFEAGVTAAHVRGAVEAGKYGGTAVHEYQRQIVVM